MPGFPVLHCLPEFAQTHVHPLLPSDFPSIRVFSSESALRIRWPKYWSLSFSIHPSNEYPGLISFRIDWFDLQGTLKSLLSTTIQKHQFFSTQPSAVQETRVQFLGWKDPLEKEMATLSSVLAWKIPWEVSLVGYSLWNCKESDTTE